MSEASRGLSYSGELISLPRKHLFTSEKRLKLSYKKSINLEDLGFFMNEGDEETSS